MNDKNNIINQIMDLTGNQVDWGTAERMFDVMRADGRIVWDDYNGLTICENVDLFTVVLEVE